MIIWGLFIALLSSMSSLIHIHLKKKINIETIIILTNIIYLIAISCYYYSKKDIIKNDILNIDNETIFMLFLLTLGCQILSTIIYNYLIAYYPVYKISTIVSISPLITMLLSYILYKTHVSIKSAIGCLIMIIGLIIISSDK
jgi:drug/metabolite transporter (DMT)-like permease